MKQGTIMVLHATYGIGTLKHVNWHTKRAFIKFVDSEFWGYPKLAGGWFNFDVLALQSGAFEYKQPFGDDAA